MGQAEISLEKRYSGIGVSPGIVTGKVFVYGLHEVIVNQRIIQDQEIDKEINRLEKALMETRLQLQEIQKRVAQDLGEVDAALFDAHLLVLDDPSLIDEVVKRVREDKSNVEVAFDRVSSQYIKSLSLVEDEYLRERAVDIKDVAHRVLRNLQGNTIQDLRALTEPCIVLAYELAPSDTAVMDKKKVIGFGTDIGSKTSHTAIMARAMEIPAVVGLQDVSQQIESGVFALLDGYSGTLIISPTEQTLKEYGQIEEKRHSIEVGLESLRDLPAETSDHARVFIGANIELPGDVDQVLSQGADGIGLFRSEYLFINRDDLPTEEEQFTTYYNTAQKLHPKPVVIRTLDVGGDKFLSHLHVAHEMNPFLGWRGIRFSLERTDIFRAQLRAILRASILKNIRIMYPMISGVRELRQANAELEIVRNELRKEHIAFDEHMPVGTMIEVPSAAMTADILARECNFFSIGTNDLIQYSLAIDRVNEKIAHLYEPTHPAIIRLIQQIVDAGHRANLRVSLCGEMAGDVVLSPILIGLGVDELSTNPHVIPQLKKIVRSITKNQAEEVARKALALSSGEEIRALSTNLVMAVAPEILELSGN